MYSCVLLLIMKLANQIGSILLAVVVISSTIGVTVNKHYCGGKLVETALFVKTNHAKCNQMKSMDIEQCPMHAPKPMTKEDCCTEESDLFMVDDPGKISKFYVEFQSLSLQAVVLYFLTDLFSDQENILIAHKNYKPPLIAQDVTVLVQSFLL